MYLTLTKFKEDFIYGTFLKRYLQAICFKRQEFQLLEHRYLKLIEKNFKVGLFKDMNRSQEKDGLIYRDSKE